MIYVIFAIFFVIYFRFCDIFLVLWYFFEFCDIFFGFAILLWLKRYFTTKSDWQRLATHKKGFLNIVVYVCHETLQFSKENRSKLWTAFFFQYPKTCVFKILPCPKRWLFIVFISLLWKCFLWAKTNIANKLVVENICLHQELWRK